MTGFKKTACTFIALAAIFLSACSNKNESQGENPGTLGPKLKRTFSLRQGRLSGVTCMAADRQGYVYAAGFSDYNCVLFKMDAELKTLIKMVRFGGTGAGSQDMIKDMAIDSRNNIFITGYTKQRSFPVTKGCYDPIMSPGTRMGIGNLEGFVVKFSPDLKLLASTFIGGESREKANAIAIDSHDDIYVAGYSTGAGYKEQPFVLPAGAFDSKHASQSRSKAFVAKLSNDLSTLKAATLLGGNTEKNHLDDQACDLAIDRQGHVWVTGQTKSPDFPVTPGCIGRELAGESDAFVSKFDADLKHLLASTYIGGGKEERANAIVIDGQGNAFVGGWSESPDMLVFLDGYDTTHSRNEEDAFIVKLDSRLTQVQAGTFLGGDRPADPGGGKILFPGDDKLSCMALSDDGKTLYVAGRTESRDFDTTPPSRKEHGHGIVLNLVLDRSKSSGDRADIDNGDGFVARFDTTLSTLLSSKLLGGISLEYIDAILLHNENLYLAGETYSLDFPGIPINYGINATRGFLSCLPKDFCPNYAAKKPRVFKPQFTGAEIKEIADSLAVDLKKRLNENDIYPLLGKYAQARISRKPFETKIRRLNMLYGVSVLSDTKLHHYNYYQQGPDGYDWIELCYVRREASRSRHGNTGKSLITLTIIARNRKWQLVDVDYRTLFSETDKKVMKKRLL